MTSAYAASVLKKPNLLGFWTLGDANGSASVADSSGNGHSLTVAGGVTLGETGLAVGDAMTAAAFDGSTGYAYAPSEATFNFEWTQPWTVEALFTLTSLASASSAAILSKALSAGAGTGFYVGFYNDAGTITVAVSIANSTSTPHWLYAAGSIPITTGVPHHIVVCYDGSGAGAGVTIWIDGVVDTGLNIIQNSLDQFSIVNSADLCIGAAGSAADFFDGILQYVAFYGASGPGTTPTSAYGAKAYNICSPADYCIGLLGTAPPTDPSGPPNVIVDTDISTDIDDVFDLYCCCQLAAQGKFTIVGVTVCSSNADSASAAQAILDYFGLSCPVYAYQGSSLPSTSLYTTQTAAQFEAGDATDSGCTAYSISGGGTLNQVGDLLIVPGGATASGSRGRATKLTVSSVSGGAITGLSISDSGSYAAAPSGAITLPNLHSGTAATVTLTYTTRRGNYTNALTGMRKLLATYSNVYFLGIGFATNFAALLASAANAGGDGYGSGAKLITDNSPALVWVAGFSPSNSIWGASAEFDMSSDPASAAALVSGSPVWPSPIVEAGVELTDPTDSATVGVIEVKPTFPISPSANPMQFAYLEYLANGGPLDANGKRIAYSAPAICFLSEGVGGGHLYWRSIGITETINSSTGANSETLSPGTPPWSSLGLAATGNYFGTWITSLLDYPGPPANGTLRAGTLNGQRSINAWAYGDLKSNWKGGKFARRQQWSGGGTDPSYIPFSLYEFGASYQKLAGQLTIAAKGSAAIGAGASLAGAIKTQASGAGVISGSVALTALAGLIGARTKLTGTLSGSLPFTGKLAMSAKLKAATSGAISLFGRAGMRSAAVATPSGIVGLAGRVGVGTKASAAVTAALSLSGRIKTLTALRASAAGAVGLSGAIKVAAKARAGMAGVAALVGRISISVKAAGAASGTVALQGFLRTATAARGSLSLAGLVALVGRVSIAISARAAASGAVPLSAKLKTAAAARAAPAGAVALRGLIRTATAARGLLSLGGLALVGRISIALRTRATASGTAPLSGRTATRVRAAAILSATAALRGRLTTRTSARGMIVTAVSFAFARFIRGRSGTSIEGKSGAGTLTGRSGEKIKGLP